MIDTEASGGFRLDEEPAKLRDAYGRNRFGQGCLLARRLVERGVSFVEVTLDGWDTHSDNFDAGQDAERDARPGVRHAAGGPEGPRHAGEHARRVDGRVRPDAAHQPARPAATTSRLAWSTVLAGAGVKGGQAIGSTEQGRHDGRRAAGRASPTSSPRSSRPSASIRRPRTTRGTAGRFTLVKGGTVVEELVE